MNKLKLMTIIGTRPEIIRLSAVIKKCDVYFDQILVHTGQNYDYNLNQVFFEDLGLRAPNFYLDAVGKDLGETIGNIIAKSYALMVEQKPDALLILGDTNSCLSAIAAKRLHIPIFHMEAGNRCFDECLPEETNRRIVDHISDVNMCYSEHARRYLNAEGTAKERTFVTGSPMAEVLHANLAKIEARDVLERLGLDPPTARKTSIQSRILSTCSPPSTIWPRPTTCRFCTAATPAAKSGWMLWASSWTSASSCTSRSASTITTTCR